MNSQGDVIITGLGYWIMPMHIMDFGFGGGGGGGGGTSAQLKCVWARNVFARQRKSLTLDKIIQFLQLYAMV